MARAWRHITHLWRRARDPPVIRQALTRAQVLKNLAYLRNEIGRLYNSIAFVNDMTPGLDKELRDVHKLWQSFDKILTDTNATEANEILISFPTYLRPFACCVVYDSWTGAEIWAAILLSTAQACDSLSTLTTEHDLLYLLGCLGLAGKQILRGGVLRQTQVVGGMLPWTDGEINELSEIGKGCSSMRK